MIETYFEKIEKTILDFRLIIKSYSVTKKIYNQKQGFVNGNIFFINDSQLRFIEVKDIELESKVKYRYHYMDKNKQLIFRFDNANHHKEIKTYPHHRHSMDKVSESFEPQLFDVLVEIQRLINQET